MATTRKPKKPATEARPKRDVARGAELARLVDTWDLPAIAAMRQLDRPLRTDEGAFYLTHGCGDPISAGELANRRVNGGGPAFHRAGRWPVYTIAALDKYAKKRRGPPPPQKNRKAPLPGQGHGASSVVENSSRTDPRFLLSTPR
jgi:hypothetical protein